MCCLVVGLLGCTTPTHTLLRSKCGAADGGAACETEKDEIDCKFHEECPLGELCKGTCVPCFSQCDACPAGAIVDKQIINGCVLCTCSDVQCKVDAECPKESVCIKGSCLPCAKVSAACPANACPWNWKPQPFSRNGCSVCECMPFTECKRDADCGAGMQCYRGQSCEIGCKDLSCCYGNFCGFPGCKDPAPVSCSIVGCAQGMCLGKCDKAFCKCGAPEQDWVCNDPCGDAFCGG